MRRSTQQYNKQLIELEERYRQYLKSLKRPNGSAYGEKYVYDKLSRFRFLTTIVNSNLLSSLSKKNFITVVDEVIGVVGLAKGSVQRNKYGDHLVVLRQLYEMKNKKEKAPRRTHYGGSRCL